MSKTKNIEVEKSKIARCRYCHRFMGKSHNENHCVVDGWEDDKIKIVTEEECEKCNSFDSKYIEYPLTINGIENKDIDTSGLGHECGCLCEVRPCGEEYKEKKHMLEYTLGICRQVFILLLTEKRGYYQMEP